MCFAILDDDKTFFFLICNTSSCTVESHLSGRFGSQLKLSGQVKRPDI